MRTASAIPENLYSYSDHCTRGAQELQNWVRGALTPAIQAYERGGGACLVPIDAEVTTTAAAASRTDAEVRRVGHAFQQAGSASPLPTVGTSPNDLPNRPADGLYRMSDEALDIQLKHQAQIDAGAALAAKMSKKGDPANLRWITEQLDLHANDGFFAAGFYNSLTANQIAELMGRRGECAVNGNDQALANALASGALSAKAAHNIVTALGRVQGTDLSVQHWHITEGTQLSVLQAIANNRTAARNFVDLLNGADLHRLVNLSQYSTDGLVFTPVFHVLSQAALTHDNDPAGMRAFMKRVSTALHGVDLTYVPGAQATLLQFLAVGMAGSVADPGPGMTPKQLTRWIENQSAEVDSILSSYLDVIIKSNAAREGVDDAVKSITSGAVLNILPWGSLVHSGSSVLDNLVIGGLQSGAGIGLDKDFEATLGANLPGDGKINVLEFTKRAGTGPARIAMWTQLAKHGYLVDSHNKPVDLSSGDTKALIADMSSHPHDYSIKNGSNDLQALNKIFDFTNAESKSYNTILELTK
ncbi:hypothetical protein U2F26_34135 [Micromonospora sp. 4G57]|uniref:Uncharacterized protein n=1 Tax=Micromonospora sicca TaxID=2202420 RepID=A0ABU5JP37_9ACTN|nr:MULTISPECIES: hypothetical protein [unclassified Micromonospora]MDZ5447689.1 hypothetical protein [Micromonospora sp. 4G57]MDZ5494408.1 hypothetical protein [Micromonospora sp. 4G53]